MLFLRSCLSRICPYRNLSGRQSFDPERDLQRITTLALALAMKRMTTAAIEPRTITTRAPRPYPPA